jgi:methylthioribose-1-phosphate isomerase
MRTIEWDQQKLQVRFIDQRCLPGQLRYVACSSCSEVAEAIRNMTVRGAPAIGVAAAFGLVLTAQNCMSHTREDLIDELKKDAVMLRTTRPTAVNIGWALDRMLKIANQGTVSTNDLRLTVKQEALKMAEEDVETNHQLAEIGSDLIHDGDTIIHHCNTGALAAVDWGTALGCIRMAHEQGKRVHVLVDETRPRLQGARLTAWELDQYQIPYEIITDGAAGGFLRSGKANKVMFGADRVAANGDIANKTGTYMLALAASENQVPVISVFPSSTVDFTIPSGEQIPIEERNPDEVLNLEINGERVTPLTAKALNPAFDITPNRYISMMVTEKGLVKPPFHENLLEVILGLNKEK